MGANQDRLREALEKLLDKLDQVEKDTHHAAQRADAPVPRPTDGDVGDCSLLSSPNSVLAFDDQLSPENEEVAEVERLLPDAPVQAGAREFGPCGKHPRKIAETPSQAWYRAYESPNADKDPAQHCPECDRGAGPAASDGAGLRHKDCK